MIKKNYFSHLFTQEFIFSSSFDRESHFSDRLYLIFIGFSLITSLFINHFSCISVSLSDMIFELVHHKYFFISVNVFAPSQRAFMIKSIHFFDKKSKNQSILHWHFSI
jgi:hypothetical protein